MTCLSHAGRLLLGRVNLSIGRTWVFQVPLRIQTDPICTVGNGVAEEHTEDERDEKFVYDAADRPGEREGREQMMPRGARRNPGIRMVALG